MDPEVESMYRAYRYCKIFSCTMSEYESRPFKETTWMLKIDDTYHEAIKEKRDEESS